MIEIKKITKVYKTKYNDVTALNDVSLYLGRTGLVFILGKSGCGKSTLLNLLGGLDKAESGKIIVDGTDINALKQSQLDEFRNYNIGFIFQEYNLLDEYNVRENIALSLDLQGDKLVSQKVTEALSKVELVGYEKRKISELSGGQKQRIAIARALIKESKYILADEPTGNLDSATGEEIFQLLKTLATDKLVIVVSHDRESAVAYGDRVIELRDGIVLSDSGEILRGENVERANSDSLKIVGNNSSEYSKDTKIDTNADNHDGVDDTKIGFKPIKRLKTSFKQIVKFATRNMWRHRIRLIAAVLLCAVCLGAFGFSLSFVDYDVYEDLAEYVDKYDGVAGFTTRMGSTGEPVSEKLRAYSQETINEGVRLLGNRFMPIYASDEATVAVLTEENIGAWNFIIKSINPTHGSIIPQNYNQVVQVTPYDVYPDWSNSFFGYRSFEVIATVDLDWDSSRQSQIDYFKLRILSSAEETGEVLSAEELQKQAEEAAEMPERMTQSWLPDYFVHPDFITQVLPYNCGSNIYSFSFTEYLKNHSGEYLNNRISKGSFFNLDNAKHFGADIVTLPGYDKSSPLRDNQVIISVQQAKFMLSGVWRRFSEDITDQEVITAILQGELSQVILNNENLSSSGSSKIVNIVGYYTIDDSEKGLAWHDENIGVIKPSNRQTISPFIVSDNVCNNNQPVIIEYIGMAIDLRNFTVDGEITKFLSSGECALSLSNVPYVNSIYLMADSIKYNNEFVKPVFGYVTLGAMLLSIIAMLNYIWAVIADSKSKIGGLRAQGMNTLSIVTIYLIEALIVSLMAVVLGIIMAVAIGSMPGMSGVEPTANRYMHLKAIHFGFSHMLAVLGLGVGVGVAGSILPIALYARKTPVELIRDKK